MPGTKQRILTYFNFEQRRITKTKPRSISMHQHARFQWRFVTLLYAQIMARGPQVGKPQSHGTFSKKEILIKPVTENQFTRHDTIKAGL
jgi:aromatic ring-cleaving dioxygenase